MEGYEVTTSDDEKVGKVVGLTGENMIVEYGTLFKHRRAVPRTFASVDDEERSVCVSISKDVIDDAPEVASDGTVDAEAVALHYGLAESPGEPAEGYGDVVSDDPRETADQLGRRLGVEPAEEQRARVREGIRQDSGHAYETPARPTIPPDPHR